MLVKVHRRGSKFRATTPDGSGGELAEEGATWHEAVGNLLYYHQSLGVKLQWQWDALPAPEDVAAYKPNLIAAAPDLLAACRGLLMCSLPVDVSRERHVQAAIDAIAKATGGRS